LKQRNKFSKKIKIKIPRDKTEARHAKVVLVVKGE
jgi:hypothetical protein